MLGGRLDGARTDWEAARSEGGVVHARRIGGEVATLYPHHLRPSGVGWLGRTERCQPGLGAVLQQVDAPRLGPDVGGVPICAEQCPCHRPDVLRHVPVIDYLDSLAISPTLASCHPSWKRTCTPSTWAINHSGASSTGSAASWVCAT